MPKVVERRDWVALGLRYLDSGQLPSEVTIEEAAAYFGVGKGSFYTHFGTVDDYYNAIIEQYEADRTKSSAAAKSDHVAEPTASLWMLFADAADSGTRDLTVRRWASLADGTTQPRGMSPARGAVRAAEAVTKYGEACVERATALLEDWGFPPSEAAALAMLLAPAVGAPAAPALRKDAFGQVLAALGRAVPRDIPTTEVDLDEDHPGRVVMIIAEQPGSIGKDELVRRAQAVFGDLDAPADAVPEQERELA